MRRPNLSQHNTHSNTACLVCPPYCSTQHCWFTHPYHTPQVTYTPTVVTLSEVQQSIEDCGFNASVLAEPSSSSSDPTTPTTLQLLVGGMTCASCSSTVERTMQSLNGVIDANVNLATGQAVLRYIPAKIGVRDIIEAVEASGYEASLWKDQDDATTAMHQ